LNYNSPARRKQKPIALEQKMVTRGRTLQSAHAFGDDLRQPLGISALAFLWKTGARFSGSAETKILP
jgi:hypothetical protein